MGFVMNPLANAQPAVLALEYRFEIMPGGIGTATPYYINPLLLSSASNVTYGPGLTGSTGYTAGANGLPDLSLWADNWNSVFDATDYNTWSLTVVVGGYTFVVDSIVTWARRSSTGPVSVQLRSSASGYTVTIWVGASGGTNVWKKHKITAGLPSTMTTLGFRFYGYGSTGAAGTLRIDTLRVYGHLLGVFNLPVEFLSFTGRARDSEIDLRWSTATEHDNDHFTIEKSYDITTWEDLAQVTGAGNSEMTSEYTLVDRFPRPGLNYYRLSQTDIDGTTVELKTIAVIFGNSNTRTRVMDVSGRIIDDWNTQHIFSSGLYLVQDEYGNVQKLYIPP